MMSIANSRPYCILGLVPCAGEVTTGKRGKKRAKIKKKKRKKEEKTVKTLNALRAIWGDAQ